VKARYALAPAYLLLAGRPVAHLAQGLVLWKLSQPFRARSWLSGVASGGTAGGKAELQVYACRGGTFKGELTSTPPRTVAVSLNDLPYVTIPAPADVPQAFAIPSIAPKPLGSGLCRITLRANGPFSVWATNFVRS
jgi:hypothetical protein